MSDKDKVYYDESCYVCSLEINAIRKKGEALGLYGVSDKQAKFIQERIKTKSINQIKGNYE